MNLRQGVTPYGCTLSNSKSEALICTSAFRVLQSLRRDWQIKFDLQ